MSGRGFDEGLSCNLLSTPHIGVSFRWLPPLMHPQCVLALLPERRGWLPSQINQLNCVAGNMVQISRHCFLEVCRMNRPANQKSICNSQSSVGSSF